MLVSVRIYWQNSTHFSDIADIMSRNKSEKLLHYFHFTSNLGVKLDPWLHALRANFLKVLAEEFQSIDEIKITFKGKSSLRQCMTVKAHKVS